MTAALALVAALTHQPVLPLPACQAAPPCLCVADCRPFEQPNYWSASEALCARVCPCPVGE